MDQQSPRTLSVPAAGKKYFNLGRNASYEAARRGELPVIQIGRLLRVPVVAMEQLLNETKPKASADAQRETGKK
jgi:hypothetical protein